MIRFLIITITFLVLSIGVTIYGKIEIKHVNYEDYIEKSKYAVSIVGQSLYENYPELSSVIIQNKMINSIDDLVKKSEAVLVIEVKEDPIIHGNAILNNGIVKKIIKGENIELNEIIQVYDLLQIILDNITLYIDNATPLQKNGQYLVFLNRAPRPSVAGTYVFSNAAFGHIRLNGKKNYLKDYENYSMPMKDILKYDYVFLKDSYNAEDIERYEGIVEEALNLLNE